MLSAGRRPGLSLIEVVVALVILLTLAAAVLPGVIRPSERERMHTAISELQGIIDAMQTMRSDNQDWPLRLNHLSTPITTQNRNICGATYAAGKAKNWKGPYLDRVVPPTGLDIGIGVAQDSMVRVPAAGSGPGGSQIGATIILINGVTREDAVELNRQLDADADSADGGVRWTVTDQESGMVQVQYVRPIKGC